MAQFTEFKSFRTIITFQERKCKNLNLIIMKEVRKHQPADTEVLSGETRCLLPYSPPSHAKRIKISKMRRMCKFCTIIYEKYHKNLCVCSINMLVSNTLQKKLFLLKCFLSVLTSGIVKAYNCGGGAMAVRFLFFFYQKRFLSISEVKREESFLFDTPNGYAEE
jgi:hypothetical protein